MPIYDYNRQRTWDGLYQFNVDSQALENHPLFGQTIHYSRERAKMMMSPEIDDITWYRAYWSSLTSSVAIPTDASIVFVGCGFGFLADGR